MVAQLVPLAEEEQGAEVVEFIAFCPWLLIIGLIIWQFLLFGQAALIGPSAAREGARAAAAHANCDRFINRAMGNLQYGASCQPCEPYSAVSASVRVLLPTIDIPYVPIFPVIMPSKATFRCEPPDD